MKEEHLGEMQRKEGEDKKHKNHFLKYNLKGDFYYEKKN